MVWDATKSPGDLITSGDWNDMVADQKGHASRHKDGGSDEIDAAELSGGLGTSGQVLQTDGSSATWSTFSSGASVSDDGTQVLASPNDVNYGSNLAVTDDGDGSVTVDASGGGGSTQTVDGNKTLQQVIRFGAEGSSTTSSSYVAIEESDIALDFDDFEDSNVYMKLEAHLENDRDYLKDSVLDTYSIFDVVPFEYIESENQYWFFDGSNNQVVKYDTGFNRQSTVSYTHSSPLAGLTYRADIDRIFHADTSGNVTEIDTSFTQQNSYNISVTNKFGGLSWDEKNNQFLYLDIEPLSSVLTFDTLDSSFNNQTQLFSYTADGFFATTSADFGIQAVNDTVFIGFDEFAFQHRNYSGGLLYSLTLGEAPSFPVIGHNKSLFVTDLGNEVREYGQRINARVFRQNAGTAISNTEIIGRPKPAKDWDFAESGWIDLTGESGKESYQLQLRREHSNPTATYNSAFMKIATD